MAFMSTVNTFPKDSVFVIPFDNDQSLIYTASKKEIVVLFHTVMPQRLSLIAGGGSYETNLQSMPVVDEPAIHAVQLNVFHMFMDSLPTLVKKAPRMDLLSFIESEYAQSDMSTLFMRALHQGGLNVHFLKETNASVMNQWQDAWGKGLLSHPNAIKNGWNVALVVLAIALHQIGQVPDPESRYDFGMNREKANAFMNVMDIHQKTNMRQWLFDHDQYLTSEQNMQLQNLIIQLELGVLEVLHLREVHTWWSENTVQTPGQALEISENPT